MKKDPNTNQGTFPNREVGKKVFTELETETVRPVQSGSQSTPHCSQGGNAKGFGK